MIGKLKCPVQGLLDTSVCYFLLLPLRFLKTQRINRTRIIFIFSPVEQTWCTLTLHTSQDQPSVSAHTPQATEVSRLQACKESSFSLPKLRTFRKFDLIISPVPSLHLALAPFGFPVLTWHRIRNLQKVTGQRVGSPQIRAAAAPM